MKIKTKFYNYYKCGEKGHHWFCDLIPSVSVSLLSMPIIYREIVIGFGWLFWSVSIIFIKKGDYDKA